MRQVKTSPMKLNLVAKLVCVCGDGLHECYLINQPVGDVPDKRNVH